MRWMLALWILTTSLLLSRMMGFHMVAFDGLNAQSLTQTVPSDHEFSTRHFLSGKCACSGRVLAHLLSRAPVAKAHETIYFIDGDEERKQTLESRGYEVILLSEESAAREFGVIAVPLLQIRSHTETLYSGAYGDDQKHVPVYRVEEIVRDSLKGEKTQALPVFGCINSKIKRDKFSLFGDVL